MVGENPLDIAVAEFWKHSYELGFYQICVFPPVIHLYISSLKNIKYILYFNHVLPAKIMLCKKPVVKAVSLPEDV